ncbi:hypothetical protein COU76_05960 [Candidatus Peregrinibacteria bacterium CG10_big_fil_rev_8_21_14_0_10_49_10]|nr:MAG: hypothetical protein COU76_05960 [Candidatus Peregrinibacteria bacterium CG10_big_fil_rev_8_21_14_0_10_49_10]
MKERKRLGNIVPQSRLQVGVAKNCPPAIFEALRAVGFVVENPENAEGVFLGGNENVDFWSELSFHLTTKVGYGVFDVGLETWKWHPGAHDDFGHLLSMPPVMPVVFKALGKSVDIITSKEVGPEEIAKLRIDEVIAELIG